MFSVVGLIIRKARKWLLMRMRNNAKYNKRNNAKYNKQINRYCDNAYSYAQRSLSFVIEALIPNRYPRRLKSCKLIMLQH